MSKDRYYFPHDYHARSDFKIKKMIREMGAEGYGIYWQIVEMLHENGGSLPMDLMQLSYDLRVKQSKLEKILQNFELFTMESDHFFSKRVNENITERENKSIKARESISKRYERTTNVLRTYNDPTTIKGKEKKEKEIKGEREESAPHSPGENLFSFLSKDAAWIDTAKKALSLNGSMHDILYKFCYEMEARNNIEGRETDDIKAHFISWAKKGNQSKPQTQTTETLNPYEAARKIDNIKF